PVLDSGSPIEEAKETLRPVGPAPSRGHGGMHRTRFQKIKNKNPTERLSLFFFLDLALDYLAAQISALANNDAVQAMHNLKVLYDFRGFDSSNELQCTNRFQNRKGR